MGNLAKGSPLIKKINFFFVSYLTRAERKQAVLEAVSKLDDVYRVPILLFYMEGQSIKAIAKEIHVPEGTVKRRLWAARKKLSQELEVYIGHE